MTGIREYFKKLKVSANKLIFVIILSIIELVCLLYYFHWIITPENILAILAPLIQIGLIFERKDKWATMSEDERKDVLLSEDDITSLLKAVQILICLGKNPEEILEKIKSLSKIEN